MWEGGCQVVCVNNKEIIGLCCPVGLAAAAQGPAGVGWGMALALHTIKPTRGSNGGGRGGPSPVIHEKDVFVPQAKPSKGPGHRERALN